MTHPFFEKENEPTLTATVLVIDDDNLSLQIIVNALKEARYRVMAAATAAEGLYQAEQEQPNLIITNIAMPDTDNVGLVDALRACAPEASLIAMIEYGAEQLAARALKHGAEDFLLRPVHPWEITAVSSEVLERAELRRRNRELTAALQQRQKELEQRNAELEEVNSRLREATMWKENLAHMIIHDLKNPLGVVQGTLIFFKGTLSEELDDKQSQLLESALISADRGIKLVSAILDVHRLEEGRMPLDPLPVSPREAIQACLDEMHPLLIMHNLTTVMDVPEKFPEVWADHSTLIRIIGNLLDNAIKFTPTGGTITIKARQVPTVVQFSVTDTGYGIPPEQQERVFEKFAQASIRAEGQRGGVGLGLTFCKLAVEAHNGKIWVESKPGIGTTFHFTIPIWTGNA